MPVFRTMVAIVLAVALTEASLEQPPRDGRPLQQTPAALVAQGHEHYKAREWQQAVDRYEAAREADPAWFNAYFFLAHSYDQLYDPQSKDPLNRRHLENAATYYTTAAKHEIDPQMRRRALEYLVAVCARNKLDDPEKAGPAVLQLIELDPTNVSHRLTLAGVYEQVGRNEDAERALLTARSLEPNNIVVYRALAGLYNRTGDFPKTMEALERIAALQPRNAKAHQDVAVFYWEKVFRDPRLTPSQKRDYVAAGVAATDRALALDPDYLDPLTYKNILLRMQANDEPDPIRRQQLLSEADALRSRAVELNKRRGTHR